jgi:hypothetical protein
MVLGSVESAYGWHIAIPMIIWPIVTFIGASVTCVIALFLRKREIIKEGKADLLLVDATKKVNVLNNMKNFVRKEK